MYWTNGQTEGLSFCTPFRFYLIIITLTPLTVCLEVVVFIYGHMSALIKGGTWMDTTGRQLQSQTFYRSLSIIIMAITNKNINKVGCAVLSFHPNASIFN